MHKRVSAEIWLTAFFGPRSRHSLDYSVFKIMRLILRCVDAQMGTRKEDWVSRCDFGPPDLVYEQRDRDNLGS